MLASRARGVQSLPALAQRGLRPIGISGSGRLLCTARPSSSAFDHKEFTAQFLTDLKEELPKATDPALSATLLRRLVKSGSLKFTDMRDAPEKFFLAHRLLAASGTAGFGIRFTVQYNLFAGSILGLASAEQQAMLDEIQREGQLGCFMLTEKQAGVLSGLIVETTAEWDPPSQTFILDTPSDKAAKNWISQGYTAELGVVIADLRIGDVSHGPHPFFLRLRETGGGTLLPGITVEDMGTKTIANDLDNARVRFDRVRLSKSALLNRFAEVRDDAYFQTGRERMRIEVIGQRLLTGRQAIAEAALVMARAIHSKALTYAQSKVCNGIAGDVMLSQMPQLKAVFDESDAKLGRMERFVAGVEARLNECLRTGGRLGAG
jgi:acyl-CoA oxidase